MRLTTTTGLRSVTVYLTEEDGAWTATSPHVPALFAGGDSREEAKQMARAALEAELDETLAVYWS
jgi:predicted RNase H-like HicB family nuclease